VWWCQLGSKILIQSIIGSNGPAELLSNFWIWFLCENHEFASSFQLWISAINQSCVNSSTQFVRTNLTTKLMAKFVNYAILFNILLQPTKKNAHLMMNTWNWIKWMNRGIHAWTACCSFSLFTAGRVLVPSSGSDSFPSLLYSITWTHVKYHQLNDGNQPNAHHQQTINYWHCVNTGDTDLHIMKKKCTNVNYPTKVCCFTKPEKCTSRRTKMHNIYSCMWHTHEHICTWVCVHTWIIAILPYRRPSVV